MENTAVKLVALERALKEKFIIGPVSSVEWAAMRVGEYINAKVKE